MLLSTFRERLAESPELRRLSNRTISGSSAAIVRSGTLEKPLPGLGDAGDIHLFDIFDYTCSADVILGGVHEMLARELHENYLAGAASSSAHQTWMQLPEDMKDANRLQASRIQQLLGSAGYKIYPMQYWDAGSRTFSIAETEKMASLEHTLWCQAKKLMVGPMLHKKMRRDVHTRIW
ncbi:MAG TPA: hypothetical protein PLE10_09375 [Brevefilum sp.]|nr:hypothetical protein [Brevefilum sp.]HOR20016.1 hypothetical protein [Brevefilum sp.]HPL69836.1 hypothetical protein [Brevefilum sp.]